MDDNEITAIVTGAPETIWLVYGELERDDTHANCYREGDVGWCDETQYASDVRYVRADIAEAENDRRRGNDVRVLETAVAVVSRALDALVGACLDADGRPCAPDRGAVMRAKSILPPVCKHAFKKA